MAQKEKTVITKKPKQLQAFIDCLRDESNTIGNELAKMIPLISNLRASQLGIDLMLTELEAKLKK